MLFIKLMCKFKLWYSYTVMKILSASLVIRKMLMTAVMQYFNIAFQSEWSNLTRWAKPTADKDWRNWNLCMLHVLEGNENSVVILKIIVFQMVKNTLIVLPGNAVPGYISKGIDRYINKITCIWIFSTPFIHSIYSQ